MGDAIGFTGTQSQPTESQITRLRACLVHAHKRGYLWMHNGDCIGSDKIAAKIWASLGGFIHLHPPTSDGRRAFIKADMQSEPLEYLQRNRAIVDASDELVAIPLQGFEEQRSGTWSTVRYARRCSLPVTIIWPDGRVSIERAKAIEAGTVETERLDAQHESAGRKALPNG